MLRRLRRTVEYLSLAVVILIPFLSYLNYLRQAYGKNGFHIAELSGGWVVGKLFALYELTLGRLEDPVRLVDSVKGTFWSITLFGLNISDPLAGIGHFLATRSIYLPLIISLLIPVLFTIIFGRAFCGWICPINTLMEGLDALRKRLKGLLPWMRDVRIGHGVKYWVLLVTLIIVAVTGIPFFSYYLPYLVFGREVYNVIFFKMVSIGAVALLGLVLFEFFLSRRGWCRYLCPSGALLSLIGGRSIVKVRFSGKERCPESCNECNLACPMALEVREGRHERECTNCGECILACPNSTLGYTFGLRKALVPILLILLTGVFYILPASAHHIAGLPHYGYAKNYPQVPTDEQVKEVEKYVVSLTTIFFQGINQKLSNIPYDTQFYIHIYDKILEKEASTEDGFVNPFDPEVKKEASAHSGKDPSYRGRLSLTILNKEGKEVALYGLDSPSEEAIYRFRHYFKRPGDYILKVAFYPDGKEKVLTFPVSIEVSKRGSYLTTSLIIVAIVAIGLYVYYRKRSLNTTPAG